MTFFIGVLLLGYSCQHDLSSKKQFESVDPTYSGLDFTNEIIETKETNYYVYQYLYNGGGVGIGDINNDGLPDIYFTSTIGQDKLYLNEGKFKFRDISQSSGIAKVSTGFKSGISMVDINNDGWLDIYVCRAGWKGPDQSKNLLFINQKNNSFIESANDYGLDDPSHSVQAGFQDFDKDGDLDMYLANHPGIFEIPLDRMYRYMALKPMRASDKFYRNDNGVFKDVTEESGIRNFSYSLGLTLGDLNEDGWTDIYVANDFEQSDFYYVNNGDGTFTESLADYFPHCSYFAMGTDLGDINNDQHLDLFVVEMLAEDNLRQKTNMAPMNPEKFNALLDQNQHVQYMRNSMQLSLGNGHFIDVADYANISQSDWSWGTLIEDFDHDSDNDIVVANGFLHDTQDKDLKKRRDELVKKSGRGLNFSAAFGALNSTPIQNYAFENLGQLKFEAVSSQWGFDHIGFSNGLATGDMDNDGDLDLIVNNINSPASVYRNNQNDDNYIILDFQDLSHVDKLGTLVKIYQDELIQTKHLQVVRGFQSSSQDIIQFGVSQNPIDSITIKWPDGSFQTLLNLKHGTSLKLKKSSDRREHKKEKKTLFSELKNIGLKIAHIENDYNDFNKQVLLPHLLSRNGPALDVGDFNQDGLEDIFMGGAKDQEARIYLQNKNGEFEEITFLAFANDKAFEDVDAQFLDSNKDGLLDIFVTSGGNEYDEGDSNYQDRLYLQNSNGVLERSQINFPYYSSNGAAVSHAGDLFSGNRHIPSKYPFGASSVIIKNDGTILDLNNNQMINDSEWVDLDNDGDEDLVICGEWTNPEIYLNTDEGYQKQTIENLDKLNGWYFSLKVGDLNNDGFQDILLGNLGLNYKYKAQENKPFEVYGHDFDANGKSDIVLGYYNDETLYPVRGFQCSSEQIPDLKKKINSYEEFGLSSLNKIYGESLDSSLHLKAHTFSSMILWNRGDLNFEMEELPVQAQLSPIQDFVIMDVDEDDDKDIICAGNWFVSEVETPRADSGTGLVLINKGDEKFEALSVKESGFFCPGDVRRLKPFRYKNQSAVLVGNNNSGIQLFTLNPK